MNAIDSALKGMQSAQASVDATAARLARVSDVAQQPSADEVDLSAEAVNLLSARNAFSADVKVAQTADEMQSALLNILG